ncbi:MAG: PAS domain S-box protein [Thermodesulfobacteriota bacterium]
MSETPSYEELKKKVEAIAGENAALKNGNEKFRQLIENAGDIIFTVDEEGNFVYISPNCESILGYLPDEFIGKPFEHFVHPDDAATIYQALSDVFSKYKQSAGGRIRQKIVDYRAISKSGQWKWLSAKNTLLKENSGHFEMMCTVRDITQQKAAEDKLKESEERYRFLVEASNDIVWTFDVSSMTYTYCSKSVERILGYCQEQTVNAKLDEIFPRETKKEVIAAFSRAMADENVSNRVLLEAPHCHKNGGTVWMEINALLHTDGLDRPVSITGITRDISDRKRAEEALQKSEEKYRTILEGMEDGYFEVDLKGNFTFFNDAICKMLGYAAYELMGLNYRQFMDQQNAGKVFESFNHVYRTGASIKGFEWQLIKKNGRTVYVETSVSPITGAEGRIMGFKGVARDVSQRKEAEQEKERLHEQLRHAQKMEAVGTLAGGIAHDFNNILSSVIGYTELALDETQAGTLLHSNLSEVLRAANRATKLVKQILALSRQQEQEFMPVEISPMVKEAIKLLRTTMPASIDIRQKIGSEQLVVYTDPSQFHQVIVNLATNARDAMPDETGVLEIHVKPVAMDKDSAPPDPEVKPGHYVQITIKDTGIGIAAQDLDKIFDPYFSNREKRVGGIGLGLSVVHGIVKRHNGFIHVDSAPGEGTTVSVFLPLAETCPPASSTDHTTPLPGGTEHLLLLDDEPPIAKMQQQRLEGLGYTVTVKTSSMQALSAFQSSPDAFDLIITDMAMPNMTGDKLARKAKALRSDVPVILCTGFSEKVAENGPPPAVEAFLMKPVDKIQMARTVRKVLDDAGQTG